MEMFVRQQPSVRGYGHFSNPPICRERLEGYWTINRYHPCPSLQRRGVILPDYIDLPLIIRIESLTRYVHIFNICPINCQNNVCRIFRK